jgi:hypothetical protein
MLTRRFFLSAAAALGATGLAGCSMEGMSAGPSTTTGMPPAVARPPSAAFTADNDVIGDGSPTIGVLAYDEVGNLSDGTPGAISQAIKLAAANFAGKPSTIAIRRIDGGAEAASAAADALLALKVRAIIGPGEDAAARAVAARAGPAGVTVLSLSRAGDPGKRLYGAGVSYEDEAAAAIAEAGRRGYAGIVVVTSRQRGSDALAAAMLHAAGAAGIKTATVSAAAGGSLPDLIAGALKGLPAPGAVFFATSPDTAHAAVAARGAKLPQDLPVIGNAGWSLAYLSPREFSGAWYTAFPLAAQDGFLDRFLTAWSSTPTPDALIAYDLTILTSALPLTGTTDPYRSDILTASHGFTGQAGPFSFDPKTGLARRRYQISKVG